MTYVIGAVILMAAVLGLSEYLERRRKRRIERMQDMIEFRNRIDPRQDCL